ncbi:MAG: GNAT family N-acetyltransferase [Xenococcus sp. MO_188.B8]|nr:GNAT family N-acetyltransferase [Xenococcus sp. MO_188.B8]
MNVSILDLDNPLWKETLEKLSYDAYHLPEYVALEAKRNHSKPEALLITEADKIFFVPYLLRSCNDLVDTTDPQEEILDAISPYGYPGILLSDGARNSSPFVNHAFKELQQTFQARGICSAFLRFHPILSDGFAEVFPPNSLTPNGETVSIDLNLSSDKIWAQTRRGHQSTINKCKRLGLTARTVTFADYIDEFLSIYQETMDRLGARDNYYFDRDYFTDLLKLGDRLHLIIVESDSQIICASLFFESCGIVQAHLGGTKTDFMKQSPFNLLLHHARLWAKERGNKFLHLGGGVGGNKDKLFTFKSGFSRQRHKFFTMRLIIDESKYQHLVKNQAQTKNISISQLKESNFFPAYRFNEGLQKK